MESKSVRLQSAIEFLITYGWAILIIILVLSILYTLGIFSQGSFTPNLCTLPADIGCISAVLFPNGALTINIEQATQYTINVVAVGCNDRGTPTNALMPMNVINPPVTLSVGGNSTFTITCYSNGMTYNAPIGQMYRGFILINYTDLPTGFLHTAEGSLIQKVQ